MQVIHGGLYFINILICYHSTTRHETSETNLENVPTLDFKKFCFFSLHLFDSLVLLMKKCSEVKQGPFDKFSGKSWYAVEIMDIFVIC